MNNERYNQIIDEAYENYSKEYEKDNSVGMTFLVIKVDGKSVYHKPDKERFVAMCTYDKTFSEKWGLKIEERKLSQRERVKLLQESWKNNGIGAGDDEVSTLWVEYNNLMTKYNIPSKLITVTYKDEKIEVYE